MPLYEYTCRSCGASQEHLQPLGADPPDACATCGGPLRRRYSRVAVKYETWGFKTTDHLVSNPTGKDFRALRDRADRIADEG